MLSHIWEALRKKGPYGIFDQFFGFGYLLNVYNVKIIKADLSSYKPPPYLFQY